MDYAFIGGGNMGRALAAAVIARGVSPPGKVLIVEPQRASRDLAAGLNCLVVPAADERVGAAHAVVLAVKPQSAAAVFRTLRALLKPQQVVISIMAGVTLATIRQGLAHEALVRVMPNTPAQIGHGMNVYFALPAVSEAQLTAVVALLRSAGEALAVASEDAIDAATAVSGSGPAYVFYLAEHWMLAAQQLGFTEREAAQLVQQTLAGAAALWKASQLAPATLREQVTSKGGTTAAAMEQFEARQVGDSLRAGIERAYRRAKELAG
ncbi:MAG: pyrroline-5-carboxylate reductase [Candidatus Lambdaproteobacteria bacterium]|nr:pyrroline-5-carboxylate reductase [Candidatus Lambdaproteobacteria bacterium]